MISTNSDCLSGSYFSNDLYCSWNENNRYCYFDKTKITYTVKIKQKIN